MNSIAYFLFFSKYCFFFFIALMGINFLIAFHELGHFLFCKLFGIKAPTFSIGMGPFIFSKKIGDTVFGLAQLPLGGYVEIAGLEEIGQGEQKSAKLKGAHAFSEKPFWQKLLVLSGGIIFNIIFAYAAITATFMIGLPKSPLAYPYNASTTIDTILPDSPAERAGLSTNDCITHFNGAPLTNTKKFLDYMYNNPNKSLSVTIKRNNKKRFDITLPIEAKQHLGQEVGSLGILFTTKETSPASIKNALQLGFSLANDCIIKTAQAFKALFTFQGTQSAGGPIAILKASTQTAQKGITSFLLLLSFISINLAVFNLLPLPILDGGQILFASIEAAIQKPLNAKAKEYIHIASWACMLVLIVFLSARDIYKLFEPIVQKMF